MKRGALKQGFVAVALLLITFSIALAIAVYAPSEVKETVKGNETHFLVKEKNADGSGDIDVAGAGKLRIDKFSARSGEPLNFSFTNKGSKAETMTFSVSIDNLSSYKILNLTGKYNQTRTVTNTTYAESFTYANGTVVYVSVVTYYNVTDVLDNYTEIPLRVFSWDGRRWAGFDTSIGESEERNVRLVLKVRFGQVKYSLLQNYSGKMIELDPILEGVRDLSKFLVLEYNFDTANTTGSTIADLSPNRYDGQAIGSVLTGVASPNGEAWSITSSSTQYIDTMKKTTDFRFTDSQNKTIVTYVRTEANTGANFFWWFGGSDNGAGQRFSLSQRADADVSKFIGESDDVDNCETPSTKTWTVITTVWNGTHLLVYNNNTEVCRGVPSPALITGSEFNFTIGGNYPGVGIVSVVHNVTHTCFFNQSFSPIEVEQVNDDLTGGGSCNLLGLGGSSPTPEPLYIINISFPLEGTATNSSRWNVTNSSPSGNMSVQINLRGVNTGNFTVNGTFNWSGIPQEAVIAFNTSIFNGTAWGANDTINFTHDNLTPQISHGLNTLANETFTSQNFILANFSVNETFNASFQLFASCAVSQELNASGATSYRYFYGNITGLGDGNCTYYGKVRDTAGQNNETVNRTLIVDRTTPKVVYSPNTQIAGSFIGISNFLVNASDNNETYIQNVTVAVFNTTHVNITNATLSLVMNFTTTVEGNYSYNISVVDRAGNVNTTASQEVSIDLTFPKVSLVANTEAASASLSRSWVVVNVSVNESNINRTSIVLWNSSYANYSNGTTSFFQNYSGLADGIYNYNVTTTDKAGNSNTTGTQTVTVDTTIPYINFGLNSNTSLNNTFQNYTSVLLNFSYTELNNHTFIIRNGSTNFTNVNATGTYFFYNFTGLNEGNFTAYGWINDTAGNVNQTGNLTIVVDTTQPNVLFAGNSLPDNAFIRVAHFLVNGTVNDTYLQNATIRIYNASLTNITNSTGSFFVNFTTTVEGNYSYNITGIDRATNSNVTATVKVAIDLSLPNATFGANTQASANISATLFLVNASANDTYIQNVTVTIWNSTHTNVSNSTGNFFVNFTTTTNSAYQYNVTVFDKAGNSNTSETRLVVVDSVVPSAQIFTPSGGQKFNGNITLEHSASDENTLSFCWYRVTTEDGLSVQIGNTTMDGCGNTSFSMTIPPSPTSYRVRVYANDTAGNEGQSGNVLFVVEAPATSSPTGGAATSVTDADNSVTQEKECEVGFKPLVHPSYGEVCIECAGEIRMDAEKVVCITSEDKQVTVKPKNILNLNDLKSNRNFLIGAGLLAVAAFSSQGVVKRLRKKKLLKTGKYD